MALENLYRVAPPTLDRWEVRRRTVSASPVVVFEVSCIGWCDRRKRPLFSHSEVVEPWEGDLKVSDVAHHFSLVCEQDRPTTQEQFLRGLRGEHWEQPELPW